MDNEARNYNSVLLPKHVVKDGAKWLMLPSKIILDSLNLWPERQNNVTTTLNFLFLFSYIFIIFGNCYYMGGKDRDLASTALAITALNIGVESSARIVLTYVYKERLAKLLLIMYFEFWPSNIAGNAVHQELIRGSRYLFFYCSTYTFCAFVNVAQYAIFPLFSGEPPLRTAFPFSWEKSPYYELIYVWESFVVMSMPFNVCGYDLFLMSLLFNCVAQFKVLRVYFQSEVQKALKSEGGNNIKAREIVNLCIRRHNKLIWACNEINQIFTYFLLMQYFFIVVAVCLSSFIGTVVPEESSTAFPYLMGHMSLIFIYSYMGNELIIESTKLSNAAYECGWHLSSADKDLQKSLIMIMIRSQRPIRISTGGFGFLSMTSFMKLIQFSFSVYTLLNSLMQKQKGLK